MCLASVAYRNFISLGKWAKCGPGYATRRAHVTRCNPTVGAAIVESLFILHSYLNHYCTPVLQRIIQLVEFRKWVTPLPVYTKPFRMLWMS